LATIINPMAPALSLRLSICGIFRAGKQARQFIRMVVMPEPCGPVLNAASN